MKDFEALLTALGNEIDNTKVEYVNDLRYAEASLLARMQHLAVNMNLEIHQLRRQLAEAEARAR